MLFLFFVVFGGFLGCFGVFGGVFVFFVVMFLCVVCYMFFVWRKKIFFDHLLFLSLGVLPPVFFLCLSCVYFCLQTPGRDDIQN